MRVYKTTAGKDLASQVQSEYLGFKPFRSLNLILPKKKCVLKLKNSFFSKCVDFNFQHNLPLSNDSSLESKRGMTLKLSLYVTIGWIYPLYLRAVSVELFSLNGGPLIINEMLKIWKTRFKVNLLGWKSYCSKYLRYRG